MAIAKGSTDLWGYVQRALLEEVHPTELPPQWSNTVRLVVSPTLSLREVSDPGWHNPANSTRAEAHLAALESAVGSGRQRRAARHRAAWMHAVHSDRIAHARDVAGQYSMRLDPMGKGPLLEAPVVHYRDRLPWALTPVSPYRDERLPARATTVVDRWNSIGEVFDRYYLADEPRTASLPTHSLIGAITTDGRSSDWFVLDRWAS